MKIKSISDRGPISKKVISSLKKSIQSKVINISDLKEAKINAEDLDKTIISEESLTKLDPLHGIYAYAQNKMSVFIEQLAGLPVLSKLTDAYADAEDEYMPSGPPMSPLTYSYFSCWGFFDLCAGQNKETFGMVTIDMCKVMGVDETLIRVFEIMQNSRMGFYVHEGLSGNFVMLRELITDKMIKAIVPSGYLGNPGQIWFARIMPEPFQNSMFGYSLVFTTPYVISEMIDNRFTYPSEKKWLEFFERTLPKTGLKEKIPAYESFMKYGLERNYWNEYIFEGYVNYEKSMIILAGFPDIPLSRPHSRESQAERGE